ncbi:hypothetical protein AB7C87_15040 [Natrarchaeobius sp. A-rgal3]|uniref:DUF7269 family protein n=1 Tax=Natrarchaeobius versutus TaxID=1679078 RepID=UPI00350EBD3A
MSRRQSDRSLWAAIDRAVDANSERLSVVVIAVGAVLATASIVLGGFVPSFGQFLIGLLYLLAMLLPAVGLVLALPAIRWVVTDGGEDVSSLVEDEPPEVGVTRTSNRIGRETGWTLDHAANGWYRCQPNDSTAEVRNRLAEGALRAIKARRGHTVEAAGEALRTGRWTDDPVAAAFLGDDLPQPFDERLRGAVDPGAAYDRRIRRTLLAIEALERIDVGQAGTDGSTADESTTAESTGDKSARAESTADESSTAESAAEASQ